MPAFGTKPPIFISPGDTVALVDNAAIDTGVTNTQAVVIAGSHGISIADRFTVQNTTNQAATIYAAVRDYPSLIANYSALTNGDSGTAATVAAGSTASFSSAGPFLCGNFGTAPTSGSLLISR